MNISTYMTPADAFSGQATSVRPQFLSLLALFLLPLFLLPLSFLP